MINLAQLLEDLRNLSYDSGWISGKIEAGGSYDADAQNNCIRQRELVYAGLQNGILELEQQLAALLDVLDVFFKVVVVNGKQYRPGYPLCEGCDELTIARGWECFYKPHTTECKYPEELILAAKVEGDKDER